MTTTVSRAQDRGARLGFVLGLALIGALAAFLLLLTGCLLLAAVVYWWRCATDDFWLTRTFALVPLMGALAGAAVGVRLQP